MFADVRLRQRAQRLSDSRPETRTQTRRGGGGGTSREGSQDIAGSQKGQMRFYGWRETAEKTAGSPVAVRDGEDDQEAVARPEVLLPHRAELLLAGCIQH